MTLTEFTIASIAARPDKTAAQVALACEWGYKKHPDETAMASERDRLLDFSPIPTGII